jgi:hypothetical protein
MSGAKSELYVFNLVQGWARGDAEGKHGGGDQRYACGEYGFNWRSGDGYSRRFDLLAI